MAHRYGSKVFVDGAHAPGMIDIDVQLIQAEYYSGNCHKWMYTPKGCAFLWVSKSISNDWDPQPCVISSSGKHDYVGRFEYTGTRDYTAFAVLPDSIAYYDSFGKGSVTKYCKELIQDALDLLIKSWKTYSLVSISNNLFTDIRISRLPFIL